VSTAFQSDFAQSDAFQILAGTGGATVTVPDVVGQTQGDGTTAVEAEGLVVAIVTAASNQPIGTIISQSPVGGTLVLVGSTVTLTVSSGDAGRAHAGGVKKRSRRRLQLEVDGEVFSVKSEAEALEVLESLRKTAEEQASIAVQRATKAKNRPIRKIMADARKALREPEVTAPADLMPEVSAIIDEIGVLFRDALLKIELSARMRQREDDDDEEAILLLL